MSAPTDIIYRFSITEKDKKSIREVLESTRFFYDYEVDVAVEIAHDYLTMDDHNGYHFLVAEHNGKMIGYANYGLIPCTKDSYDLYWIGVHNDYRGKGIGLKLLLDAEKHILELGGKRVYIETSSTEKYAPTQGFYFRAGYILEGRLKDYYREGDDKLMYSKIIG